MHTRADNQQQNSIHVLWRPFLAIKYVTYTTIDIYFLLRTELLSAKCDARLLYMEVDLSIIQIERNISREITILASHYQTPHIYIVYTSPRAIPPIISFASLSRCI